MKTKNSPANRREAITTTEPYRLIFDASPNPMWVFDEVTLQFLAVNDAALKHYGWSRKEFLAVTVLDVLPTEERARAKVVIRKQRGAREAVIDVLRHLRKDGTPMDMQVTASSIPFAGRPGRLCSITDVTDRKRVEEAMHASEVRYRRLFETAKEGILILDAETGMVVEVNPFLIKLLGYSHKKFLGKKVWELGVFKDIAANQDKFVELQTKKYVRYEHLPLETSDGYRVWVEFVSNVYQVNRHKVIQCNIRDITDRKQADEAIHRFNEKLERCVTERTRALATSNESLRTEMEQRRISHDLHDSLGQHLTALKHLSSALGTKLDRRKVPGGRAASRISRELGKAVVEIRQIARGLQPIRAESESLMSALQELATSVTKLSKIPCRFECPLDLLMSDYHAATHLYRIAQEAVHNAVRHAKSKHIWIKFSGLAIASNSASRTTASACPSARSVRTDWEWES